MMMTLLVVAAHKAKDRPHTPCKHLARKEETLWLLPAESKKLISPPVVERIDSCANQERILTLQFYMVDVTY